ncbi:hypothetical protein AVEN_25798-1 [Araneus ventricosus]|uniref:Uncharacterized protein n=1 Tax=Araneus ventricosus TaxID=182803 RepID=A0A4Y2UAM3_ARAVE|nr:hypothetical protein AVEN_25798-1 [Araneus ventricosus]
MISKVPGRLNAANELPQIDTQMIFQCTKALDSIKALLQRGIDLFLCDHPSCGPHRILFKSISLSIRTVSNIMRLFPAVLFEIQGLSWWGPDIDDLKGQHITGCAEHFW